MMPVRDHLPTGWLPRAAATTRVAAHLGRAAARRVFQATDLEDKLLGERLFRELDQLKGLAMKVGQILSYMDVGLPAETVAALSRLQKGAEPLALAVIAEVIEAELGRPLPELFDDFAPTPIAAASIGQVHRATLAGQPVAVKVRYPGVREVVARDLRQVGPIARLASLATAVDGGALLTELQARLLEECDYRREAAWLGAAARLLAQDPAISVPDPQPDRCGESVLTTRWVEGADFATLRADTAAAREAAALTLARFPWMTLLNHGLLHADPHPGNFLFPGEGRVVALDWGCVRRFSPDEVEPARALVAAVLNQDRTAFRAACVDSGLAPDPRRFDFDAAWGMFTWLYQPYRAPRFHFTRDWWTEGLVWTGPGNPNQRSQGLTPAWIWLLRMQWGLHAVLVQLDAAGDFGAVLRDALHRPLRPIADPTLDLPAPAAAG